MYLGIFGIAIGMFMIYAGFEKEIYTIAYLGGLTMLMCASFVADVLHPDLVDEEERLENSPRNAQEASQRDYYHR